eukprot:3925871-Rhodomonas_salina.1
MGVLGVGGLSSAGAAPELLWHGTEYRFTLENTGGQCCIGSISSLEINKGRCCKDGMQTWTEAR